MADAAALTIKSAHPVLALWRSLKRLDKAKINDWWMALRNSLSVGIPLAVGIEMGNPLGAVAVAIGALNVSYSDGHDPYLQRARRMLLWSGLSAVAVFAGSLTGSSHVGSVLFAAAWAFAAGMMLAISPRAGDLGLNTLVTVIVFAARGVTTPLGALYSGLLVFGGGVLQIALALLFWPLRRNKPQMLAIGKTYLDLSAEVNPDADTPKFVPLHTPGLQVQDTLNALGRDHSVEGERFRLLFDQADRIRLSIYLVKRLRDELGEGDSQRSVAEGDAAEDLDEFLKGTSMLLQAVGDVLMTGVVAPDFELLSAKHPDASAQGSKVPVKPLVSELDTEPVLRVFLRTTLRDLVERAQQRKHNAELKLGQKIAAAVDVLVGQLRMVVHLAENTAGEGESEFLHDNRRKPWKLQTTNWRATLRAHMTWSSPVFRHAVRLSVCVTLADVIERGISWQRAYWLPMTVAVVLKPDFATTFSRGALRLAGTIAGLMLATAIYLLLPQSAWTQLFLVGAFTFLLRYLGPANYGVFTLAVSGLIVFLIAATGIAPGGVIVARALNTIAGGLLALLAYAIWPTWERSTISDSLAEMLNAARDYFRAVTNRFGENDDTSDDALDQQRTLWRLKRTEAEAALDRFSAEPGSWQAKIDCLTSIMASSHSLVHAAMGLEAGLVRSSPTAPPEAFRTFANDVDFTLYFLAGALRGSLYANKTLPQLREDHRRMLEARDTFSALDDYILIETDRLTVSLNTLREQVIRYVSGC